MRANLSPDDQIETFMESLNPSVLRAWKPISIPSTFDEVVSSIRIALQVNETIRQAELNSKMKSTTITSIVSSSSPPRRSSTSTLPKKNDPSRPGPFAVNPEKSIHRIRAQNGWCTRCGMKSHNTERCPIYPATKSNKENFELWLQMRKNTSIKIAAVNSNCENNTCDEPLYEVAVDDENTAEIFAYLSTISKRQLTQALARKQPPHFFINFTLLQGEISTQGKALVDSGATRSFIGSSFLHLHKIATVPMKEPQRLTLANGKSCSPLRQQTTPVLLSIAHHDETIILPVFETTQYDLILGLDWLTFHNPTIDWENRYIRFDGYGCKHRVGIHQVPVETQSIIAFTREEITQSTNQPPIPTPTIDISEEKQLPESTWPMSEFPEVFDMEKQAYLPNPRKDWDFDVKFKEGAVLPKPRPLFRLPLQQRKAVEDFVAAEIKSGKLRPSNSPVAANLFFVTKKDSAELRPCVDYRDLNASTIDDRYPLPPISELIQSLVGGDWYAKFDWRWAYNNIRIKEGSEWKFALKCHLGLYEPTVMPFGPKQAPGHMQRFVREMCKDFLGEGWLVNILDDFVIRTQGSQQLHRQRIRRYLQRIKDLGVYIKQSKCVFFAKEVEFVGFKVNSQGYWKQPDKLETIRRWGTPRSVKDVRAFMGFVNFYRPFAKNLSTLAKPLFDLTIKNNFFKWEPRHQKAFDDIKANLLENIFLMFPRPDQPFYLHFDSSDLGTGAVLQQLDDDGHLRPLEFYSKKWNAAEFNYSTPDKELYGLVLALKHWYQWLYGATEVIVYTDHKSLRDFSKTKLLKPRHARWALVLEDYKGRMKVHWIPGKTNTVADAASRDPNFALSEVEMKERAEHQVLPTEAFPTEDHIDSIMADLETETEVEHHSKGSSLLDSTVRNGNGEGSDFPLSVSFRSPDEQEILLYY
ncbi:hypothetical protein SeLEV6574_g07989 [Synchytrium endobioticum]|uniref:RNA-directed DNA polymerase n=1 Tax=Synchytrium endobioticum TaxID=286115 RepID=A0A507CB39_9FUNG|nr:hypothetical protein SeLEV6574_g07989 [Synchytrium endobioticum]